MSEEKQYTEIQARLWPDKKSTDPMVVEKNYDELHTNYSKDSIEQGWGATFDNIIREFKHLLPVYQKAVGGRTLQILDAGCGDGLLVDRFDFKAQNVDLAGVDISGKMIEHAKEKNVYKELQKASLYDALPYPDETFDFIISNGAIGYVNNAAPLHDFTRAVKAEGYMLLTMRTMHYDDWGYPQAFKELKGKVELLRTILFDPYPNNPGYTNEYRLMVIRKVSSEVKNYE